MTNDEFISKVHLCKSPKEYMKLMLEYIQDIANRLSFSTHLSQGLEVPYYVAYRLYSAALYSTMSDSDKKFADIILKHMEPNTKVLTFGKPFKN